VPALPLDQAGIYVAAAFLLFVALILVYVAIIGAKIARIERELTALSEEFDVRQDTPAAGRAS
jgi:hypothetical protein